MLEFMELWLRGGFHKLLRSLVMQHDMHDKVREQAFLKLSSVLTWTVTSLSNKPLKAVCVLL